MSKHLEEVPEGQSRTLESDLQEVQEKLDKEQKQRVKFQKQAIKSEEELRQAKLRIDDLIAASTDQYVELKRLQEENANQRLDSDDKVAKLNRGRKQLEFQLSDLQVQLDDAITAKIKVEKQKKDLEASLRDFEESFGYNIDAYELRNKQLEIDELEKNLTAEQDRHTKDEEIKKKLRKEIQTQEEIIEDLERNKRSAERIRKRLEEEVELLKTSLDFELRSKIGCILLTKKRPVAMEGITVVPVEDFKNLQNDLNNLKIELESAMAWRSDAEKRERICRLEIDELRGQVEEEMLVKLKTQRRCFEVELEELKEQISELEEQLAEAEESNSRKDIELEARKHKIVDESELTVKFDKNSKYFEKEIERFKLESERENKRPESDVAVRTHPRAYNCQTENELEDLREQVDALEETCQDLEDAKTRLEVEVEEIKKECIRKIEAHKAAEINCARIKNELAELRENYDADVGAFERTRKKIEADYEDIKEQLEEEIKKRNRLEREIKARDRMPVGIDSKFEIEKLRAHVARFDKMENDYKKLQARLIESEDLRRAAEKEKERISKELRAKIEKEVL